MDSHSVWVCMHFISSAEHQRLRLISGVILVLTDKI